MEIWPFLSLTFPQIRTAPQSFWKLNPLVFYKHNARMGFLGLLFFWFFVYRQMHQLPVCPPVVYEWKPLGILDGCKENANLLKFHSFQNNKFSEKRSFSFGKYSSQCHFSVAFNKYSKLHICLGQVELGCCSFGGIRFFPLWPSFDAMYWLYLYFLFDFPREWQYSPLAKNNLS